MLEPLKIFVFFKDFGLRSYATVIETQSILVAAPRLRYERRRILISKNKGKRDGHKGAHRHFSIIFAQSSPAFIANEVPPTWDAQLEPINKLSIGVLTFDVQKFL